ncbi:MAG: M4 family metallopeptidase [Chloroflexi bacterium]|nr:M4 family metallopeptidase [Chloroflexota bacterium]
MATYTANNKTSLPGAWLCTSAKTNCTNGQDLHADSVTLLSKDVADFYADHFNRNNIVPNRTVLFSTVHYGSSIDNAYWNGAQMVYGDAHNWPLADDVVAHELTHGVTQYESNLFYFYQSGAINESFSDLWGEYYDQTNGTGSDEASDKWLIGEDILSDGNGAFRSMSNPPQFGDPDKMSSTAYVKSLDDNGGVHSNSGVNNKAVFLMVDGGTFNGQTVTSLGWDKTAAIYYEVNTNLLSSGADYSDLYYAVQQACVNLSATNYKGITSADCIQVKKALDAVQMNGQPAANFHMEAAVCPAGQTTAAPVTLFGDDFENGIEKWEITGNSMANWYLDDFYATSPTHMMYGDDVSTNSTSILQLSNAVKLPSGTSYLYFKHAYLFDYYNTTYYDGGVLEYSTDNGATWKDAKPLYSSGKNYAGVLQTYWDNPLGGRSAFSGDSHGYVSSQYNLTSIAGKSVKFRWVLGTDNEYYYFGWVIDDVKIYTCVGYPSIPAYTAPADKALVTDYTPLLDWADATPNLHHYQVQVATDSAFSALVEEAVLAPSQYTVSSDLPSNTTYYWRVRSFNAINETKGWTVPRSFRTALTPPVLTPLTLPLTNNRPTFDWSDVLDTTNYTLQVSTSSTFASPAVNATVNGSIYTPDKDLPAGKTLYWRVRSNGANGPSDWATSSTNFTSANPPSVPVLATPLDKALTTNYLPKLDWNNSTTPLGVTLDGYQLQVATDPAFSSVVLNQNVTDKTGIIPTVVSEFTLSTPLAENTAFYWRVRSYNSSGQYSAWSLVRSIRTALPAPTLSPSSLPENGKALDSNKPTFNWDDVPGATGYTLQVSTVNTFASFVLNQNTFASTYTPVTGLLANKTLFWRVIATGANGPSLPSNSFTFTTANPPPMPVLSAPVDNLLVSNAPKLDWANVVAPAGVTLDGYQVQLATDPAFSSDVQPHDVTNKAGTPLAVVSEFTPAALTQNTKYYWHVRSFDDKDGNLATLEDRHYSSWSLTRSFRMIIPAPVLDALALPADNATATLKRPLFDWSDVSGATGYTIQVSTVSTFASTLVKTNTTASNFTPTTDLPASKTLFWRVIANGANGPSLHSNPFTFTTANPPPAPTLSAPLDNALVSNTLTPKLDWANVVAPVGVTLGGYQLQVATDSGFSSIMLTEDVTTKAGTPPTVVSEFTLPTLTADTKYFWRVRSFDSGVNYSSWSLTRSFRMVMPAPTLVSPTGSVQTNRPTFDWDDVPNATGYTVQVSTVNTFASILMTGTSTASTYTPVKDLPANKTLFWRVIANGANGPSLPSGFLSITTAATPSIPLLSAPADNLLVTDTLTPKLDWTNSTIPAGVTFGRYQLEVATDAAFSSVVLTQDVSGGPTVSEFTLTAPLSPNTKYYWRVRSFSSAGNFSGWSLTRSFRIPMTAATLVSPSGTLPTSDLTPAFDWDDVPGATSYSIQIYTTSTFSTTLVNTTASSSTFTPTANLPANTLLFWRVMAQGPNGPSKWSAYYSFSLQ